MVRLAKEHRWSSPTLISFGGTVVAALAILVIWHFWPTPTVHMAHQRGLQDVTVQWQCPARHTFEALGSTEPRSCPICSQPADVVMEYQCPEHGGIKVFLRYRTSEDGRAMPDRYSFDGQTWQQIEGDLLCPQCTLPITRKPAS